MKKIAVLTSGGDSPGMNACIRAVVRTALFHNIDVYGVERGYEGLINGEITRLNHRSVSDIIHKGGTFLKTSRCPEFKDLEVQKRGVYALSAYGIEGLVVIGGDGTFRGAKSLSDNFGIKVMGIPGTIDNDLAYTDYTLGFDTTVNTVLWAINNLRDTMHSHDRVSLLEVMGRHSGDIALYSGIAGGAEYILVPEVPYDLDEIASSIRKSSLRGKTSNTIVLAEGAGDREEIVQKLKEKTGINVKVTVLGYIQRGGSPNMADRVLAAKFAIKAVEMLKNGENSSAIGIKNNKIIAVDFEKAFSEKKEFDKELLESARILGL
ncbi:MAG: 6-phosphofructokinase [Clostridiales bacterium]|nr:6-phosphofructokinase [Clostridiales bacterium]